MSWKTPAGRERNEGPSDGPPVRIHVAKLIAKRLIAMRAMPIAIASQIFSFALLIKSFTGTETAAVVAAAPPSMGRAASTRGTSKTGNEERRRDATSVPASQYFSDLLVENTPWFI